MRIFALLLLPLSLVLQGCEQPTLTAEQKQQGYCRSVVNAAKNIMLDRQQGISLNQAREHALKVPDASTRAIILAFIDQAYAAPKQNDLTAQEQAMDDFAKGKYELCLQNSLSKKQL